METAAENRAEEKQHRDAIEKATENMTVDLPPVMVENRISQMINELSLQLQARGMNFESYMQVTGNDMEKIRESYRESAEQDVRMDLMLEAVAKAENVEVTQKEIEYEIAVMAATYRVPPKQVVKILKENRQFSAINNNVRRRKAMQFIIDNMAKDKEDKKAEEKPSEKVAEKAASKDSKDSEEASATTKIK